MQNNNNQGNQQSNKQNGNGHPGFQNIKSNPAVYKNSQPPQGGASTVVVTPQKNIPAARPTATSSSEYGRLIIFFIIGIIVGAGGYWLIKHSSSSISYNSIGTTQTTDQSTSTTSNTNPVIPLGNGISVSDQQAGFSVNINNISIPGPVWVAIHDDDNGVPGKILGAVWLPAGQATGTVALLRTTVAGQSYFAVLHSNNSQHVFDVKADTVMIDSNSNTMEAQFTALPQGALNEIPPATDTAANQSDQ